MHINMKYYVVSIGAIFIALGIGILVGFNLNYDEELTKQQSEVINDLDSKFEALRETNDTLEGELEKLQGSYSDSVQFINDNYSKIIAEELVEKNIGIISTNKNNNYTKEVEEVINEASGNVAFDIAINSAILDEEVIKELGTTIDVEMKTTDDVVKYILNALKEEDAMTKLQPLQDMEVIAVNSISESYLAYGSIVLTGGSYDKDGMDSVDKIDKLIIDEAKKDSKYVVGVQKSDMKFSYIDFYLENKIGTVDNVDQGTGKVSLVTMLKSSEIVGNYGNLETAESIIPYNKK